MGLRAVYWGMARKVPNNFNALATHAQTWDVGKLACHLIDLGWWDKTHHTILRHACANGTPADIDALVKLGVALDEDIYPALQQSALHVAASGGNADNVRHLITRHGLSPDLKVGGGGYRAPTPMQALIERGNIEKKAVLAAAEALLELGAGPNGPAGPHEAAHRPLLLIARKLAHPKKSDTKQHGAERMFDLLLRHGADPGLLHHDALIAGWPPMPLLEILRNHYGMRWVDRLGKVLARHGHAFDWDGEWNGQPLRQPPDTQPDNVELWNRLYVQHQEARLDATIPGGASKGPRRI